MKTWIKASLFPHFTTLALLLLLPTYTFAIPRYTPFSPLPNVCPSCPKAPQDVVTLQTGEQIYGTIVGSNDDFYTIYRFGEYRALPNADVKAIKWSNGTKPTTFSDNTQVVLKTGRFFSGTVKTNNEKPGYLLLELPELGQKITIFKDQIDSFYVNGKKTTL